MGTIGGFGYKSPATNELQKRVRETTKHKEPTEARMHNLRKNCITDIDTFARTKGINDEDADGFEKAVTDARHYYVMRAKRRLGGDQSEDDAVSGEEATFNWGSETNKIGPVKKRKGGISG